MSNSIPLMNQDDDGPEEGEIEDDEDEDDIILLDGSSPQRSSTTTSTSLDLHVSPSPARKYSYERDIRHFELRRTRASRRRASGESKSPYSVGSSTRNKSKHSRTGLTQGKENRHVHRRKSPAQVHVHSHRIGSHERTLVDFKDISPVRRDSSISSIDSEERSMERTPHYRSTRKCSSKLDRTKRKSSSSPESSYISSKRRAHHSEKCPLMKVLHSVAKETRLIAMENSDSHAESSSLRQRLLNMGAMPAVHDEVPPPPPPPLLKDSENDCNLEADVDVNLDSGPNSENSSKKDDVCKLVQSEGTQTEEIVHVAHVIKPDPEVVILTDSEEMLNNESTFPSIKITVTSNSNSTVDLSELNSNTGASVSTKNAKNRCLGTLECDDNAEDDDDISRLRLLALQSKKHEPTSIEDADVLQLRLAALKTAFMKKFKTRKKITIKINSKPSKEDPLSPLDEISTPFSPTSRDEVLTPVDMELAETDDETGSVHSISRYSPSDPIPDRYSPSDPIPEHYSPLNPYPECYSPSDPTGSPTLEPSLQDLLPPPPPPDLDLFFPDQNFDNFSHSVSMGNAWHTTNMNCKPIADLAAPPPLPPYFRELLSDEPELIENHYFAAKIDEEESPAVCNEPIEVIAPSCEIPGVPLAFVESGIPPVDAVENLLKDTLSENQDQKPIPVLVSLKSSPPRSRDVPEAKATEPTAEKVTPGVSLEEEERILRKRLLLNMANKREKLLKLNCDKKESSAVTKKIQEPLPKTVLVKSKKVGSVERIDVNGAVTKTLSPRSSPGLVIPVPNPPVEKRIIINLGEDSDSCEDYSEAEALGQKCVKNKEEWLLHLKELEVNPPKMISPGNKTAPGGGKVPLGGSLKVKQTLKDKNGKKPFAENLADLESKVERFLKGVRTSHDAISKTSLGSKIVSSNVTPVAVRHLPASQQEEYRRLKQQIAMLEKQRQVSIELQNRASQSVSTGTQINSSANLKNSKQAVKNLHQVVPSYNNITKPLSDASKTEKKSLNNLKGGDSTAASLKPLKVSPQSSLKTVSNKVAIHKNTTALANVSNLSVTSFTNTSKQASLQLPKLVKANNAQENANIQSQDGLSGLEATLVIERSHVLSELSALAKLLSQVDKSLEAQSHTATEVSSLIDKLCLAAGRWKAQNRTVAGLVQKVAQRQKELSLRHRRCVNASRSCAQLGTRLIGKNYRVPLNKADAMRLQLRQVHEKTQALAKRKTAEQAKRNVLEKRAEYCLMKLFSDSNTNMANRSNAKSEQVGVSSSVTKSSEEFEPKLVKKQSLQPTKVYAESPSRSTGDQRIQLSSSSVATATLSSAHGNLTKAAVKSSPLVRPSLISRTVKYQIALDRVRSAKAVLNLANKKRLNENRSKFKSKRFYPNKQTTDQDCRHELSDMDISTDGEETEKSNKDSGINTDKVDMSISPSSSGSSGIHRECRDTPSSNCLKTFHPNRATTKNLTNSDSSLVVSPSSIGTNAAEVFVTPCVLGLSSSDKGFIRNQMNVQKTQFQIRAKICGPPASSRSVLKDYVSPLGGLNVFSNSSSSGQTKEKPQKGDLYAILCPYDLNGKCQDSDCPFKHQHQ